MGCEYDSDPVWIHLERLAVTDTKNTISDLKNDRQLISFNIDMIIPDDVSMIEDISGWMCAGK